MGVKLTRTKLGERYDVHERTIDRWSMDETLGFPQPMRIGRSPLWDLDEIERWERARATRQVSSDQKHEPRV
jgi:predicted DNA-binding transcriptional regulator AlpA